MDRQPLRVCPNCGSDQYDCRSIGCNEVDMTVPCIRPRRENFPMRVMPPEDLGEEWATSERCDHEECIEVEGYRLSAPKSLSREEIEEIEADTELMRDEMHGRNVAGRIAW